MKISITTMSNCLRFMGERNWPEVKHRISRRFGMLDDLERVTQSWNTIEHRQMAQLPAMYWWQVPGITRRWNHMISGDAAVGYQEYVAANYFGVRQPKTALTLGCGAGHREREWAKYWSFEQHVGVDIADKRIAEAKASAANAGLSQLKYVISDINEIVLTPNAFDVILFEQSLHHVTGLEHVLTQVSGALTSDGLVIINEFVGPSRFQWTDRQLEVVNGVLKVLPPEWRSSVTRPKTTKQTMSRPSPREMLRSDPSEAARSAEIPQMLERNFRILEWKEYGGTVLHLLFDDIAANFAENSSTDQMLIELCFQVEDVLMRIGDLPSDFIFCVAQNRR